MLRLLLKSAQYQAMLNVEIVHFQMVVVCKWRKLGASQWAMFKLNFCVY